ncbi:ABC transporter ATP-binding protein [Paenibacillus protaetiae]|uniref:ABC transporter ATP-binding protein n=1 Tax=Paenibacillus protaetiae TaxID=2509456 RepID=A0A4P6EWB1_9BACL|nr:ABC transporter ATP-binding protein [Paenibacillus protaetiae]QAY66885.1 ABC transporter ATP-binding protein [Paenibacillus protaetiae]
MDRQTVIQVSSLSKYYGANSAVEQVTLQVKEGELFGIIGTNGAGKSTLLELLTGLRQPDEGCVKVLNMDAELEAESLKEHIGIHLQNTSLVDKMTVREALDLFQSFYHKKNDLDAILDRLGLRPYEHKMVKRLSGGWQQRFALAITLVNDPKIIFLDEPTTGLDQQTRSEYWEILLELKSQGKTIVIATHDMGEAQRNCDRVAVMRKGKLVSCDSPQGLIARIPSGGLTMEAVYVHFALEQKNEPAFTLPHLAEWVSFAKFTDLRNSLSVISDR